MAHTVEGRRVEGIQGIEFGGDYAVTHGPDGRIASMTFAMPGFSEVSGHGAALWNRIPGEGSTDERDRVRWTITEDVDGKVTVAPSILAEWPEAGEGRRFHGFLKAGVWEVLDDSVGASFD